MSKLGFWLAIAIPFFLLLLIVTAGAAPRELPPLSVEAVQQKCATVRGQFFRNAQSYGCTFAKGIVKCSAGHCAGYPHTVRVRPRVIAPPPVPEYGWHDQW